MVRVPTAIRAGILAFLGVLAAVSALPDAWYAAVFCRVPAWLAAAYFHAELDTVSLILGSGRTVTVTRTCGGSDFFSLACAVLAWHAVRRNAATRLPLWWAGAWVFTVLVNGMRVIVTVWTRAFAEQFLGERLYGVAHLLGGTLVFFPALLLLWLACVRYAAAGQAPNSATPSPIPS